MTRRAVRGRSCLHNNLDDPLEIGLIYYNDDGVQLDFNPAEVDDNTVVIPPKASVSFRPVASSSADEGAVAISVPDRPRWSGAADGAEDIKLNGSIEISWDDGGAMALQGRLVDYLGSGTSGTTYSFLLPPGGAAAK